MLRHDNDGEADSKITFKGLRAVKIQRSNSTLNRAFCFPIGFQGLSKAKQCVSPAGDGKSAAQFCQDKR
jgi:hypothetical protein